MKFLSLFVLLLLIATFTVAAPDHGYAPPPFNEGKNYNPEAVRTTWVLVEDSLASHLRP